jgi:DNA primase
MNKYIRASIEEKKKELEREERRQEDAATPQSTPSVASPQPAASAAPAVPATPTAPMSAELEPLALHSPKEQASQVELLLVREIVRHGEEIIFDDVETDDGGKVSLSVAQYIDFDLSQDNLQFTLPLHRQILAEAVAHQGQPGFKAEAYFCAHPDMEVSHLATRLAIDRHQLGGRFVIEPREDSLRQRVLHLVMDYRLDIIETRLKAIQVQLRQVGNDMEQNMKLLKEHKETKELRDALARRLGSDLIV